MLKTSSLFIVISLSILSCQSSNNKIQKTWISKYDVFYSESEGEMIGEFALRKIIQFRQDSILIKQFNFNCFEEEEGTKLMHYKRKDNLIFMDKDTFNLIGIYPDSLIMSLQSNYPERIIYEKLDRYEQAKRENELIKLLTTHTFTTQNDTIKIEFRKNGTYVSPSFNFGEGSNQCWMIDKFEDELFIVFDGFLGAAVQIKSFNDHQIIGKIYYIENIEVTWNKIDPEVGYELSDLIGNWEKLEIPPLPPPPPVGDDIIYYEKEVLKISEHQIMNFEGYRKDTLDWEFNREKNIMILNSDLKVRFRVGKQFNIKSLENDTLILEERNRRIAGSYAKTQISKFKKLNK